MLGEQVLDCHPLPCRHRHPHRSMNKSMYFLMILVSSSLLLMPSSLKVARRVPNLSDVVQVDCGLRHAAAIDRAHPSDSSMSSNGRHCHCSLFVGNGRLFVWGDNKFGQLGLGEGAASQVEQPALVTALQDLVVVSVRCGARHTICLTRSHYSR